MTSRASGHGGQRSPDHGSHGPPPRIGADHPV